MAILQTRKLHARLVEARSAHSLVRFWSRKLHSEEATTLYDVVGTAASTRARDFVGSGSLFTLNGCAEAVTWDYNEDSIDVFSSEDNGLISATATVLEDNGLITDPLTAGEQNNGTVINTVTTYPYGTIDLTGVAQTPRTRDFVGSGSLLQHLVQSKLLLLITNRLIYSLLLVQPHSADLETLLDLDLYSVSVVVSRKSPSIITTIQFLYTQELITVLLPTLLQQLQMMDLSPVL